MNQHRGSLKPSELSKDRARFIAAFEALSDDPGEQHLDIKKFHGIEGYRLRIGGYRVLYRIIEQQLVIEVINIGSRGDIYK